MVWKVQRLQFCRIGHCGEHPGAQGVRVVLGLGTAHTARRLPALGARLRWVGWERMAGRRRAFLQSVDRGISLCQPSPPASVAGPDWRCRTARL